MYFALAFALAWGIWLPSILIWLDDLGGALYLPLAVLGQFAPLGAAAILIARRHDGKTVWQFIRQAFDFKTRPIYYLLALLVPLAIHAVTYYLILLFRLPVAYKLFPEEVGNPWLFAVPYFFFILIAGGGLEEFGWRGYAQQPLQERFGIIKASILIGVVWGFWHLPLWVFPEAQGAYSFPAYLLLTTGVSLVYGWLYNASGQKLIIALFFHAMWNTAAPLFPFLHQLDGVPQTGVWVWAAVSAFSGLIAALLINQLERKA
jgi:membrane protease YdiL (CAAX protease family)